MASLRVCHVPTGAAEGQAGHARQGEMAGLLKDAEQTKLGLDSYYAAGATRTLANSTLFVTGFGTVEKLKRYEVVESIFSAQPGYRGTRQ
eukprot:3009143-Prymnesium_polylepis.1